jgi:hypothetical protein
MFGAGWKTRMMDFAAFCRGWNGEARGVFLVGCLGCFFPMRCPLLRSPGQWFAGEMGDGWEVRRGRRVCRGCQGGDLFRARWGSGGRDQRGSGSGGTGGAGSLARDRKARRGARSRTLDRRQPFARGRCEGRWKLAGCVCRRGSALRCLARLLMAAGACLPRAAGNQQTG